MNKLYIYLCVLTMALLLEACGGNTTSKKKPTVKGADENESIVVQNPNAPTITLNGSTADENESIVVQNPNAPTYPWEHGNLKVDKNNRMLKHEDGTGFFWMADTAWNLSQQSQENIDTYIENRAAKKFTVIQVVALYSAFTAIEGQNPFGDNTIPAETNSTKLNEEYWKFLDYVIQKANDEGMYVALAPAWHTIFNKDEKKDTFSGPVQVKKYGNRIAERYKDLPNIIWLIGGDTPIDGTRVGTHDKNYEVSIWKALGDGINEADPNHLITFHPLLTIPSEVFVEIDWLDFNMLQSGRGSIQDSINLVQKALKEKLAVIDGESIYEGIRHEEEKELHDGGRRTPFQIREDAYSELFIGAFGNTYGHTAIYRFWGEKEKEKESFTNDRCGTGGICTPNIYWKEVLDSDGAKQMRYVTELMLSRPLLGRVPDQSLIEGTPEATGGIIATKGKGYAMIYTPQGKDISVIMSNVPGSGMVKAWWYNPRDGENQMIGEFERSDPQTFNPPGGSTYETYYDNYKNKRRYYNGNDWILVLDDVNKGFLAPGK